MRAQVISTALLICALVGTITSANAADWQIIDIQPGQSVDVYLEINLGGRLYLRIADMTGPACADLWWIKWPLGNIKKVGRRCGGVSLDIPGLANAAVASKLRAGGVKVHTKIIAAANERVANKINLNW